jgi:hypothetical protein
LKLRQQREELRRLHWLDEVLIEARIRRRHSITGLTISGQRDEPYAHMAWVGANAPCDLESIEFGKPDVEDGHIGGHFVDEAQRADTVGCIVALEPGMP